MTYIAHIFAALGLFIGSLFGSSSPIPAPVATSSPVATQTQHTTHTQTPDPCAGSDNKADVVMGNVVCSYGDVVEGADGATYSSIPGDDNMDVSFAKDAHAVYAQDAKLPGVDPATFVVLSYGYVKDKNGVYCGGGGDYPMTFEPIPGADPISFVVLGFAHTPGGDVHFDDLRLAKDNKNVYAQCVSIPGADPATFKPLYESGNVVSEYAKDATHVWNLDGTGKCTRPDANGDCPVVNIPPDLIAGPDPATFVLMPTTGLGYADFAKDTLHIYQSGKVVLPKADPESFAMLKSSAGNTTAYEKDKTSVFFGTQVVSGADRASFIAKDCGDALSDGKDDCSASDAHDKYHTYLNGTIVE